MNIAAIGDAIRAAIAHRESHRTNAATSARLKDQADFDALAAIFPKPDRPYDPHGAIPILFGGLPISFDDEVERGVLELRDRNDAVVGHFPFLASSRPIYGLVRDS